MNPIKYSKEKNTGFNFHLRRSYDRARKGECVNIIIPTVRGGSMTLIARMMNNGMKYCKNNNK